MKVTKAKALEHQLTLPQRSGRSQELHASLIGLSMARSSWPADSFQSRRVLTGSAGVQGLFLVTFSGPAEKVTRLPGRNPALSGRCRNRLMQALFTAANVPRIATLGGSPVSRFGGSQPGFGPAAELLSFAGPK